MPKREPMTNEDRLYNKRYEKETWWRWIQELNDNPRLTDWESNFIYSIEYQLRFNRKDLTEKQIDVLERIYNEKT